MSHCAVVDRSPWGEFARMDDAQEAGRRRRVDYLIVGNSAAGIAAAEAIRAHDSEGTILVVGDEPYPAYGRPLISYLLEGKTDERHLAYRPPAFYERRRIEVRCGAAWRVVTLDAAAHEAALAGGGILSYGACLVATGSMPASPRVDGASGRENLFSFLTLDDALGMQRYAREACGRAHAEGRESRALVMGGGSIGLKAAEALSYCVDEVVVFVRSAHVLSAIADSAAGALIQDALSAHGVVCRPGVTVASFEGAGARVDAAVLTNGERLSCDLAVLSTGVRPAAGLAEAAGAVCDRGIVVGSDMVTSLPDVYAAGDVARVRNALDDSERPLALWPHAVAQGRCAGAHMAGAPDAAPYEGGFPVNALDFFDLSLLSAGITNPPEDGGFTQRVYAEGRVYAKFVTKDDRLFGYLLVNRPEGAGVYTALIREGTPLSSLAGDPFVRPIDELAFPETLRWERMHEGLPRTCCAQEWKESA